MAHPKAPVNFSTPRNASKHGRFGDSLIAFLSPEAQSHLASKDNVLGTINPLTGLPEYADISEEDSFANDKWVTDMYSQVFDREADTGGLDYWSQQLDDGAVTQEDIMKSFVGSDEYQDKMMDTDFNLDTAYDDILGRAPDAAGEAYYQNEFDTTATTYDDIINSMFDSEEFKTTNDVAQPVVADVTESVSNLDDVTVDQTANTYQDADGTFSLDGASDMVESWYGEHSVNDGDEAGSAYWTDQLDAAATTPEVLAIEQAFLTALSNDNGIDDDSGDFITDTSFLTEGGGYVDTTADTIVNGDAANILSTDTDTSATTVLTTSQIEANIAAGLNGDGTAKTLDTTDTTDSDFTWTAEDGSVFGYDPVTKTPIMISGPTTVTADTGDTVVNNLLNEDGSTRTTAELLALGFNAQGVAFTETEQANIANGLNADGTPKTTTLTDDIIAKALAEDRLSKGLNPDTGAPLTATQLANIEAGRDWNVDATVVADTSGSDSEETKETVVISEEEGGTDAINLVNEALLGKSNLEEIMALLDRGNLRDLGVRYLRAIRDRNGNRIFYNLNPTEFNQNRNKLRRLYWGKTWKAVDNAEDDTGYGNRAAATSNFLGGE